MDAITLYPAAKINLTLDIVGTRPDGYHLIETIMQRISLTDILTIDKKSDGYRLTCSAPIAQENNLVTKAANLFFSLLGKTYPVQIHLEKMIPSGAGMGGGSADAAQTLVGLNLLFDSPFSTEELTRQAVKIGADVPFLVASPTALCTGIGEIITPVSPLSSDCFFVIAKPNAQKSTASIYREYDAYPQPPVRPDTQKMIDAISANDIEKIGNGLCNVFSPLMEEKYPAITQIKKTLKEAGAKGACMSGSGTAVFGLFDDAAAAQNAKDRLLEEYREVFFAQPI